MDEHAERPYKVGWYREIYNGDMNRHFRIDKVSKNTLVIAYDDGFKNNKLSIPIRKKIYTKAGNPAMASFGKKYLMLDGHYILYYLLYLKSQKILNASTGKSLLNSSRTRIKK